MKRALQPRRQLFDPEQRHTRCRQFKSQRHPIKLTADACKRMRVLFGHAESGGHRAGLFQEEMKRIVTYEHCKRGQMIWIGKGKPRYTQNLLTCQGECLPA